MKRKAIVLLTSILAGSLLVGGAFAAYAVTDNADPFGINVTPGDIASDDTTYVTLEWGQTSLASVGNIDIGENRKVGVVNLVSSVSYEGVFKITLEDKTTASKETTDKMLLDYLNVYAYSGDNVELTAQGALPAGTPALKIDSEVTKGSDGKRVKSINITGTTAGTPLTIFVNLDEKASPYFAQMSSDKVYLEVDWNAKSGHEATSRLVYFQQPDGWGAPYAYAWTGKNNNSDWPGVAMTVYDAEAKIYQLSIPNGLNSLIFNDKDGGHQTDDLDFPTGSNIMYNGSAWTTVPAHKSYYLVGEFGGQNKWQDNTRKLTAGNAGEFYIYGVELAAGDKVKVCYCDGTTFTDQPYYPSDEGTEYTVEISGSYDIYFAPTARADWASDQHYENAFGHAQHFWFSPTGFETVDVNIDLEGSDTTNHGWKADKAVVFAHYWYTRQKGTEAEYNYYEGNVVVSGTKITLPKDASFLLLRDVEGTTAPIWQDGENPDNGFLGKTADLTIEAGKTLTYQSVKSLRRKR